jgi:hypothetical protein
MRTTGVIASVAASTVLCACTAGAGTTSAPSPAPAPTPAATAPPAPPPPTARSVDWFDLDVGDCLTDPPPVDDPNVIAVAVVDCASPHRAEVYLRAPLAVNTAIADVADRKCDEGFTRYTGRPVGAATFTITYLIDSNQNRTSSNPDPSTVICLLHAANGAPVTVSARR